eukprot:2938622-Prymnesium_polylepis.1
MAAAAMPRKTWPRGVITSNYHSNSMSRSGLGCVPGYASSHSSSLKMFQNAEPIPARTTGT